MGAETASPQRGGLQQGSWKNELPSPQKAPASRGPPQPESQPLGVLLSASQRATLLRSCAGDGCWGSHFLSLVWRREAPSGNGTMASPSGSKGQLRGSLERGGSGFGAWAQGLYVDVISALLDLGSLSATRVNYSINLLGLNEIMNMKRVWNMADRSQLLWLSLPESLRVWSFRKFLPVCDQKNYEHRRVQLLLPPLLVRKALDLKGWEWEEGDWRSQRKPGWISLGSWRAHG